MVPTLLPTHWKRYKFLQQPSRALTGDMRVVEGVSIWRGLVLPRNSEAAYMGACELKRFRSAWLNQCRAGFGAHNWRAASEVEPVGCLYARLVVLK